MRNEYPTKTNDVMSQKVTEVVRGRVFPYFSQLSELQPIACKTHFYHIQTQISLVKRIIKNLF